MYGPQAYDLQAIVPFCPGCYTWGSWATLLSLGWEHVIQGCPLLPLLFIVTIHRVLSWYFDWPRGLQVGLFRTLESLEFADVTISSVRSKGWQQNRGLWNLRLTRTGAYLEDGKTEQSLKGSEISRATKVRIFWCKRCCMGESPGLQWGNSGVSDCRKHVLEKNLQYILVEEDGEREVMATNWDETDLQYCGE